MVCMRRLQENIISSRTYNQKEATYILLSEKDRETYWRGKNVLHKKIFDVPASAFKW